MISGELIRRARRRAGLSQAALARRAGKATSAIGRWERSEVLPPLETLLALVRASGLDLALALVPGDEHDRVLIRSCLAQPPAQRLGVMLMQVRQLDAMAAAARG